MIIITIIIVIDVILIFLISAVSELYKSCDGRMRIAEGVLPSPEMRTN